LAYHRATLPYSRKCLGIFVKKTLKVGVTKTSWVVSHIFLMLIHPRTLGIFGKDEAILTHIFEMA